MKFKISIQNLKYYVLADQVVTRASKMTFSLKKLQNHCNLNFLRLPFANTDPR